MHFVKPTGRHRVPAAFLALCGALLLLGPVLAGAAAQAQSSEPAYADVAEDAYYYDAVSVLAADGVFEGTDCEDGFCPGEPLKRWQMAVWLIRALGETDPDPASETRFDDVSADDWWMPYVERMADLKITSGCSGDPPKYCPDNSVTRAQMATFLTSAFSLPPAESAGSSDVKPDNAHRDNINRLAAAEITAGCKQEPLSYCPRRPVTRAQMSAFIYRSLEWLNENRPDETSNTVPTPKLISNDTDDFITVENDFSRYIRDNVVAQYEDSQPWLRDVWNHINRVDFSYVLGDSHYTSTYYGIRLDEGDVMNRSTAIVITANPDELSRLYNPAHVHELAHVYTMSNRIVADPAPIAAGHLYFSEITRGAASPENSMPKPLKPFSSVVTHLW